MKNEEFDFSKEKLQDVKKLAKGQPLTDCISVSTTDVSEEAQRAIRRYIELHIDKFGQKEDV